VTAGVTPTRQLTRSPSVSIPRQRAHKPASRAPPSPAPQSAFPTCAKRERRRDQRTHLDILARRWRSARPRPRRKARTGTACAACRPVHEGSRAETLRAGKIYARAVAGWAMVNGNSTATIKPPPLPSTPAHNSGARKRRCWCARVSNRDVVNRSDRPTHGSLVLFSTCEKHHLKAETRGVTPCAKPARSRSFR
jgi:hypothetical protein